MIRSRMDRTVAERLISAAWALDAPLGEVDIAVSEIADEHERAAFIDALGNIFRLVNEGLILPIAREYPDLMPDD